MEQKTINIMKYTGRFSINGGTAVGLYQSNNLNQLIKDLRDISKANSPSLYHDTITIEVCNAVGEVIYYARKDRFSRRFFTRM